MDPRAPVRTQVKHPGLRRHSPVKNVNHGSCRGGLHVWFKYGWHLLKMIENVCIPNILGPTPSWSLFVKLPWPASFDQLESPGGQEPWAWWWRFYKARIESGWHKEVQKRFSVCVFVWVLSSQPEISYQMAGCCQPNWPYMWVKPQDLRDCLRSQPKKNAKSATDYLKQPQKSYGCDPAKPCLKDGGLFLDQVLSVCLSVGVIRRAARGRGDVLRGNIVARFAARRVDFAPVWSTPGHHQWIENICL